MYLIYFAIICKLANLTKSNFAMRKIRRIVIVFFLLSFLACEKPDALKKEAFLVIENNTSSYNITGVYYANTGYGSNRISSSIGPGQSATFTLDAEGNYVYSIKVTSDNPNVSDYTHDDIHFYDNRRITVELHDDEWDDYYPI